MRLYSYVVRHDIGFAPNPFHGWCTLATCKQDIRAKAEAGDWVVGTGSASVGLGDRLVYMMRVDEVLTYDDYWNDPRFIRKRPNLRGSFKQQYGDNIYHRAPDGSWLQENSRHSLDNGSPNPGHVERDTKADAVLASAEFVYYGDAGPVIPERLRTGYAVDLVHGRPFHRVNFTPEMRGDVIAWFAHDLDRGLHSDPRDWAKLR